MIDKILQSGIVKLYENIMSKIKPIIKYYKVVETNNWILYHFDDPKKNIVVKVIFYHYNKEHLSLIKEDEEEWKIYKISNNFNIDSISLLELYDLNNQINFTSHDNLIYIRYKIGSSDVFIDSITFSDNLQFQFKTYDPIYKKDILTYFINKIK